MRQKLCSLGLVFAIFMAGLCGFIFVHHDCCLGMACASGMQEAMAFSDKSSPSHPPDSGMPMACCSKPVSAQGPLSYQGLDQFLDHTLASGHQLSSVLNFAMSAADYHSRLGQAHVQNLQSRRYLEWGVLLS